MRACEFGVPDALEIDEVSLYLDSGNCLRQIRGGQSQFALVMRGFGLRHRRRNVGEASVGATIGMHHQDHALGVVQAHGRSNLLQDELTVGLQFWRGQGFGAAGNFNGIGIRPRRCA